jgi:hypothetical protein
MGESILKIIVDGQPTKGKNYLAPAEMLSQKPVAGTVRAPYASFSAENIAINLRINYGYYT